MSATGTLKSVIRAARTFIRKPGESVRALERIPLRQRGEHVARQWRASQSESINNAIAEVPNPLRTDFDGIKDGPGVWKWLHYFDIYHRHLQGFVGRTVVIVEVGVYGGGSLPMWRRYFGPDSHIHGVDIAPECRTHAAGRTTIHIGDQADRSFWQRFRQEVPIVDVLIDDGGHAPEQQMVTLEEMLPHLQPGGVYLCEDIHGHLNGFATFVHSLADNLNAFAVKVDRHGLSAHPTPFQSEISSVHLYPFVTVIEKRSGLLSQLTAPKHGTQWPTLRLP